MAKEACVYPLLGVSPRSSLRAGKGGGQLRGSELDCKGAQAGARRQQPGGDTKEAASVSPQWLSGWGLGMMLMNYTTICFCTEVFRGTVEHAKMAFLPTQNTMLLCAHMPNLFSNVFGKK